MNDSRLNKAFRTSRSRMHGMSQEKRDANKAANLKLEDWYARCRRCGKMREGSLIELTKPCGCADVN